MSVTKHKGALTLSFDDMRSRDTAYAELMRLQEEAQRRG